MCASASAYLFYSLLIFLFCSSFGERPLFQTDIFHVCFFLFLYRDVSFVTCACDGGGNVVGDGVYCM